MFIHVRIIKKESLRAVHFLRLCCCRLRRRQISSDRTYSPLSSTTTKTWLCKGLACRLHKSPCNSANWRRYRPKYASSWSFGCSLNARITCGIFKYRAGNASFHPCAQEFFSTWSVKGNYMRYSSFSPKWLWPILARLRDIFLGAFWRNYLSLVSKYVLFSRAQHRFVLSSRAWIWLYHLENVFSLVMTWNAIGKNVPDGPYVLLCVKPFWLFSSSY